MKFQDSSFNGLKFTVGTKSVTHPRTHPRTHAPKAICPINFFKVGGIITKTLICISQRKVCLLHYMDAIFVNNKQKEYSWTK